MYLIFQLKNKNNAEKDVCIGIFLGKFNCIEKSDVFVLDQFRRTFQKYGN